MAADRSLARRPPAPHVRFREAARRHFVVIAALLRREMIVRLHSPFETFLALGEPLFLIIAITFAVSLLDRRPAYGPSIALFLSTGFFPYYLFIYISKRMSRAVELPRARYAPEHGLDYVLVHIIFRIIEYSILGILLFSGLYFFVTPMAAPHDLIPLLGAAAAMVMIGFGVGLTNIALRKLFPFWRFIFPPLARVAMIFTGVHYVADYLSPAVRHVLSYNPLLHAVSLFRTGFYPNYPELILDTRYLAICSIVAVFFGLLIERNFRRIVEQ